MYKHETERSRRKAAMQVYGTHPRRYQQTDVLNENTRRINAGSPSVKKKVIIFLFSNIPI
jgi:hypothetical protein